MNRIYNGYVFKKTGKLSWDWRCQFGSRTRWGTIEELQNDVDLVVAGVGLPPDRENI